MSSKEDGENSTENQQTTSSCSEKVDTEDDKGDSSDKSTPSTQENAQEAVSSIQESSQNASGGEAAMDGGRSNQRDSEGSTDARQSAEGADDTVKFTRRRFSLGRQYRRRSGPDESSGDEALPRGTRGSSSESDFPHQWEEFLLSSSSSDSSHSSHSLDERKTRLIEENEPTPKALLKPKPNHKWFAVREILNREIGCSGRWQGSGPERFQHRYYGSLHAVQRLELMYKLEQHRGCVNSLHFNRSGELLLSASDDKRVVLWDWAADRSLLSYDSGHNGNVFQAKFLPLSGDRHIVTCARDGGVRLGVLSGTGHCKGTRLLAQHRRTTHKLATHADTPHVFLSAGEDALVLSHDVRLNKASKLLFVKEGANKVGLYSIHSNPVCSNEFIVTGEDQYIRLYDKRKVTEATTLNKFCPKLLLKPDVFLHVTCAVFNYNGTEVIGSYNDDDIYLFDTRLPPESDYVHKYEGHRNSITVKGVNFFGPRSEFIVSGSDCGNIFFWDKSTEAVVQWMRGDEEGVVNCLEPHPRVPIIATSGLDSDIKIWVPSCENEPTLKGLKSTVINNQSERDQSRGRRSDPFDNRQMRWLWRQIQRFEQRRSGGDSITSPREEPVPHIEGSNSSSSTDEDTDIARPQCSPS